MKWNTKKNIKIITCLDELYTAAETIKIGTPLAIDVESTGLHRFAKAVGLGIAWSPDDAIYIPFSIYVNNELIKPWNDEAWKEVIRFCEHILQGNYPLIAHNAVYDCMVIENTLNINCIDHIISDTMLLHHTLVDEHPPHGLKQLATQFITEEASSPQEDLKESVKSNDGKWLTADKEFFKGDYTILGTYCCYDTFYTYYLHSLWYSLIKEDNLETLWNKEVLPTLKTTYELSTTGVSIDLDRMQKLKKEMQNNIERLEDEIFAEISSDVFEYEYSLITSSCKITKNSQLGKLILSLGGSLERPENYKEEIVDWYRKKKNVKHVFNLDSNNDKAHLLYNILGFKCTKYTKSGKPSVTRAELSRIEIEYGDNPILKLMIDRSKEMKLLNTYVEPILEKQIDGRIYPSFNQAGTTSGRFSSNNPNWQNIPRDDKRIKECVIPDPDYIFVNADYAQLEVRCFAHCSGDSNLQSIIKSGVDFYSQVAIDVLGTKGSANPNDKDFIRTNKPNDRQRVKAIALGIAYGLEPYKMHKELNIPIEKADKLYNKYLNTYPKLKRYMKLAEISAKQYGKVENLVGRQRRLPHCNALYAANLRDCSFLGCRTKWKELGSIRGNYEDMKHAYRLCRNELNLSKNFPIQSLAASIVNAASIKIRQLIHKSNIDAKLVWNIHDEIGLMVKKEHANKASELLKKSMENNWVTEQLDVAMEAEPNIALTMAEAKL
jgi:DNA polymerase I-like protein with 3'-5' exonuclease and polymerase domains